MRYYTTGAPAVPVGRPRELYRPELSFRIPPPEFRVSDPAPLPPAEPVSKISIG